MGRTGCGSGSNHQPLLSEDKIVLGGPLPVPRLPFTTMGPLGLAQPVVARGRLVVGLIALPIRALY